MRTDRRTALALGAASVGFAGVSMPALAQGGVAPDLTDLRVCGLVEPLALGNRVPSFAWRWSSARPGDAQTHYRITVADSLPELQQERDLVWDSGRISSAQSFDVAYGGPALAAHTDLWWQVQAWTQLGGDMPVSAISHFATGLISPADWRGEWLAAETAEARLDREAGLHWLGTIPNHQAGETCLFRTIVHVDRPVAAEILISAVQFAGAWHDGAPLATEQDEPIAWTTMTPFRMNLVRGNNVIEVAVRRENVWGVPEPVFAAILRLEDPARRRLTTRDGWQVRLAATAERHHPALDNQDWQDAVPASRPPHGEPWQPQPAMLLRRDFITRGSIRSARLYATALGTYEAWINGVRVGDQRLAPEFTDPTQHILYQTHDVTPLLQAGANAIGLWVGDGWYGSEFSTRTRFPFGPAPCRVRAQLELLYQDGSSETVSTGPGWSTTPSAVLASEIYDGEIYDARVEQPGWTLPGFAGDGWAAAQVIAGPSVPIDAQLSPPVRVTQDLAPVSMTQPRAGVHVFDFGQNFAGWVRLVTRGEAGDRVELRFAEVLKSTGEMDQFNLRSALARDVYVLKGGETETWEPRFTCHGFRYVEVHGLPNLPSSATLTGRVVHSDLPITGNLRVSDPVVQRFWQNSVWSQRSNFLGMPIDCPQRDERLAWMGDAQVFWPAAAFNMDVQAFTARTMQDLRRAQAEDGRFSDVMPPLQHGRPTTSPGWADAGIILPHTAWQQYGDTSIITDNWQAMDRYMAWIGAHNPDGRWTNGRGQDFGDWLAVDAQQPGDPTTPKDLIASAFWASNARMMAAMAGAIGRTDDAVRYQVLFDTIRAAFISDHVREDGTVGNGSQTSYVLPIRFDLLDAATRVRAGRHLAADIARRSNTLSTGFLGTPHILDALTDAGQEGTAITLLLQRQYPSWGYMVEQGATTMWERGNSNRSDLGMNSFNHYAFGAIGSFLFRRIAGIAPLEPGFRRVRIAPILDRRLPGAGAEYLSASGEIRVQWVRERDRFRVDAHLPFGVTGELVLPEADYPASGGSPIAVQSGSTTIEIGHSTKQAQLSPSSDVQAR